MKKFVTVLVLGITLMSCSVEELPCNDWAVGFKTSINIIHDGSEQIVRSACHYTDQGWYECVMITEEDYQLWIDISPATTCWTDVENSL